MTKGHLRLVSPRAVIGTIPPRRVPSAALRTREYLTEAALIKAAKTNRNGQRDATMILLAFRHGLRAAELVDLRWDQADWAAMRACTCAGSRMALPPRTRFRAMKCGRCAN